jgi:HK97 family phage major capsid protein
MLKKMMMPAISLALLSAARPEAVLGSVRAEVDAGKLEALLKDVKSEMTRVGDEVKRTAEDALKQSRDAGKASEEVKAKADELLVSQKKLTDAQEKIENKLEALETRNRDLEQQIVSGARNGSDPVKSFGDRAANDEAMRAYAAGGSRGTVRISLPVKQAITSVKPGGGGLIWSDRETEIVGLPQRTMTIRNLLTQGRTSSNMVEYAKQTVRTNNAGMVSEGVQKPESAYEWNQADANVRTVAHWVHVSRQAMEDADQLQTEIDSELRYGLMLKEESQLLNGDGTGVNLSGLATEATAYSAPFAVTGETMIDTLRLALL